MSNVSIFYCQRQKQYQKGKEIPQTRTPIIRHKIMTEHFCDTVEFVRNANEYKSCYKYIED